jgi:hypothetical protein
MYFLKKINFLFLINFLISIKIKFQKKNIIQNLFTTNFKKNVLIYFKTDVFCTDLILKKNTHPNNLEIKLISETFYNRKYNVYCIDRDASLEDLDTLKHIKFDIFLANAAGNSCPHFEYVEKKFKVRLFYLYAAGPEPIFSNKQTLKRNYIFDKLFSIKSVKRRIIKDAKKISKRFHKADKILCVGNKFSIKTYRKFNKIINQIKPAIHNPILVNKDYFNNKKFNSVVYVGGTGVICKGLDIIIESFLELRNFKLSIFAPNDENDFWNIYKPKILKSNNIDFYGFFSPNSFFFQKIMSESLFHANTPCAESMCTSVLLTNSFGIIPVVSKSSGIDVGDYGFYVKNSRNDVIKTFNQIAVMDKNKIIKKAENAYNYSKNFSIKKYQENFNKII